MLAHQPLRCRLQGDVAGRKYIRPPQTRQQIDVSGPRPYAFDSNQMFVGLRVIHAVQFPKIQKPVSHSFRAGPQISLFGTGQAIAAQRLVSCGQNSLRRDFTQPRFKAAPDGARAGHGQLLAHQDTRQRVKPRRAAAQRWRAAARFKRLRHVLALIRQRITGPGNVSIGFDYRHRCY